MTFDQIIYLVAAVFILIAVILVRRQLADSVGHAIPSIYRIAGMTFAETRRRRILQVVVFLAILMLIGMLSMTWLAPGEPEKALISGGLDLVFMLGTLVAIFICAFMIPTDIERRTIYSVLTKPVNRWEFVVGKYIGVLAVIGMLVAVMLVVQVIVLLFAQQHPAISEVFIAGLIAYFGIAVFTAAVMAVSTVASSLTTVIAGVVLWLAGSLQEMSHSIIADTEGFSKAILTGISALVPHLGKYDFRLEAADRLPIPWHIVSDSVLHGLGYVAVCLIIGALLFNERQV